MEYGIQRRSIYLLPPTPEDVGWFLKQFDDPVRIVDEGLRACLDLKAGGALAADLQALYAYIGQRLTQANLRNDVAALDECKRLVDPLRDAWLAIAPQAEHPAHA